MIRDAAGATLANNFPSYSIATEVSSGFGGFNFEGVMRVVEDVDNIALICTDGELKNPVGDDKGWDIVEKLRNNGYQGPAVYTGHAILPEDKEHLY